MPTSLPPTSLRPTLPSFTNDTVCTSELYLRESDSHTEQAKVKELAVKSEEIYGDIQMNKVRK